MTSSASPLEEATPDSLQELFDRDPLQLTDSDIEKIVTELRAQRARWEVREAKPKKTSAPATLDLKDLGF